MCGLCDGRGWAVQKGTTAPTIVVSIQSPSFGGWSLTRVIGTSTWYECISRMVWKGLVGICPYRTITLYIFVQEYWDDGADGGGRGRPVRIVCATVWSMDGK